MSILSEAGKPMVFYAGSIELSCGKRDKTYYYTCWEQLCIWILSMHFIWL